MSSRFSFHRIFHIGIRLHVSTYILRHRTYSFQCGRSERVCGKKGSLRNSTTHYNQASIQTSEFINIILLTCAHVQIIAFVYNIVYVLIGRLINSSLCHHSFGFTLCDDPFWRKLFFFFFFIFFLFYFWPRARFACSTMRTNQFEITAFTSVCVCVCKVDIAITLRPRIVYLRI